jgi:hypothetical protein
MTTFIRALALAATTAGFAVAAQAGAVLGFDDIPAGNAPGSTYNATFGVTVSSGGVVRADADMPISGGAGNVGVLVNSVGGEGFTLTIDTTKFDYDLLSFNYSVSDAGLSYNVTDVDGKSFAAFKDIFPSNGQWVWGAETADLAALGKIKSVEFRTGNGAFFGIDNIAFSLTGTTTTVPEPASLALVGLALAGMGAASRRRSQG